MKEAKFKSKNFNTIKKIERSVFFNKKKRKLKILKGWFITNKQMNQGDKQKKPIANNPPKRMSTCSSQNNKD